jgi:hypothetical protein
VPGIIDATVTAEFILLDAVAQMDTGRYRSSSFQGDVVTARAAAPDPVTPPYTKKASLAPSAESMRSPGPVALASVAGGGC